MIRLASATISSLQLFSKLKGLSANARVEPGSKMSSSPALSHRRYLYSKSLIFEGCHCVPYDRNGAREVMPECSRAVCYWKCRPASIIFRAL